MHSTEIIKPGLGQYHQEAADLQEEIFAGATPSEMARYIGEGAVSFVFRSQDERAVIKLPYVDAGVIGGPLYDDNLSLKYMWHSVVAYSRGVGVPRLEQIIGWSEAMPTAMVTEYVPGLYLNEQTAHSTSRQHWRELFDTFTQMAQKEAYPTLTTGNFLYQPQSGFTVIDYRDKPFVYGSPQGETPQSMAEIFSVGVLEGDIPENYLAVCHEVFGKEFADRLPEYVFKL